MKEFVLMLGLVMSQKKMCVCVFHILGARHMQLLIRNPSLKRNVDLLSLSNTEHVKNF